MNITLRYTPSREEAAEVLNDGFLKVFRHMDRYNPAYPFLAWFRRIVVNTAIDHFRSTRKEKDMMELMNDQQELEAVTMPVLEEEFDFLPIMQQLSPGYRMVFNLYVMEEYNHEEIGEILGITSQCLSIQSYPGEETVARTYTGPNAFKGEIPMNMDAFDKQFRDQWGSREEPEFQPGDWDRLKDKLHPDSSRRFPGWLLLLLPWLGIGGLLLLLNNVNQKLDDLQAKQNNIHIVTDTLVQFKEVVTHDTVHVYHTVIHRDTLFLASSSTVLGKTFSGRNIPYADLPTPSTESPRQGALMPGSELLPRDVLRDDISKVGHRDVEALSTFPLHVPDPLHHPSRAIPTLPVEKMEFLHEAHVPFLRKTAYRLRPDGATLEAQGVGLLPVGKGISQAAGYGAGLKAALRYGDQWQVGLGMAANQMSYEIKTVRFRTGGTRGSASQ